MWKMPSGEKSPRGGGFLLEPVGTHTIYTPEHFDNEALEMGKMAERFTEDEVVAHEEHLETLPNGGMLSVMKKAGELGLYMADVPEEYGGLDLGFAMSMLIAEKTAANSDFSVSFAAHVGIGTLPIVFYGSEEQRAAYLPDCATGERIGAYALSEPGSGSDALGARTKAVLNEAGTHYVLNGTKQWITNAGWADFFVVFAKVDGTHFTAFLVDRETPGFTTGPEENKLGLKGSSTRPLIFEDSPIPVSSVLGEVGRGHKIAFNILNVGRFKLGCSCVGNAKRVLRDALTYASERKQFKTPVVQFEAIQEKVARMAARIYAMESLCYRIAGYMEVQDHELDRTASDYHQKRLAVIEEYAVESSIAKVYCSEGLHEVADESLQMYGGYGFVKDYPAEKAYRDCRVNRIFEGTNEINRMIIPTTVLKRWQKGAYPEMDAALSAIGSETTPTEGPLGKETDAANRLKQGALLLLATAGRKLGGSLKDEQMLLMMLSDLIMAAYAVDSSVIRASQKTPNPAAIHCARIIAAEALDAALPVARRIAFSLKEWELADQAMGLFSPLATDVIEEKRALAQAITDAGRYHLSPQ